MGDQELLQHQLVPEHVLLDEKEAEAYLLQFNISRRQLPKIKKSDSAIKHLPVKQGDIIKILRRSPVGSTFPFYRVVVED